MTTAREIIQLALKQVGILGVGQTPLAEDTNDAFTLLQQMIHQWQERRWLVPSLQKISFQTDGSVSYTVGVGGDINIKRPNDIKAAYVVQRNTGSNPVSLPVKKIFSYEDYARITVKNLNSLPDHFFYDAQYPLANLFIWPLGNSTYDIHLVIENQLGFGSTITEGEITTAGAAYTAGAYETIELTGGNGTGAQADITVGPGGDVTIVTLSAGGEGYEIGDELSAAAANIGGTGAGFTWTVGDIGANVDTEIVMPPSYEEALYLNLAIRLAGMYQVDPMPTTIALAKKALNTIRVTNTQIPALVMPLAPGIRTGKAFNLWNADGL